MPVLDLGFIFRTSPIDPDLILGKSQPLFPSWGLHSSHQHPPPYLLSHSLSHYHLYESRILLTFRRVSCWFFFCSVAEGYWLKQASMSPYAGFFFSDSILSLVSDFRFAWISSLLLVFWRRIYVSWLSVAPLASRTSHSSEVSWLTSSETLLFQLESLKRKTLWMLLSGLKGNQVTSFAGTLLLIIIPWSSVGLDCVYRSSSLCG